MKNYNMRLTERQQEYQHYHLEKLVKMNILQVKKFCLLIKNDKVKVKKGKFNYIPLEKALEKQTKAIEDEEGR